MYTLNEFGGAQILTWTFGFGVPNCIRYSHVLKIYDPLLRYQHPALQDYSLAGSYNYDNYPRSSIRGFQGIPGTRLHTYMDMYTFLHVYI